MYLWDHTHCNDGITHIVFMTWDLRYLWKYMHCIWHLTHDLWHLNTLSNSSVYYISYQTEYIWQHIHCISVFTPRYRSYNPHCVYDNTGTICMTSCEYIWNHTSLYDITPRYDIHIHCFHVIRFPTYLITYRIYDMSFPIAVTSQTLCLGIYVTIFNIKQMVLRQYTNIYI